jgi:hypothetical protein
MRLAATQTSLVRGQGATADAAIRHYPDIVPAIVGVPETVRTSANSYPIWRVRPGIGIQVKGSGALFALYSSSSRAPTSSGVTGRTQ